MCFISNLSKRDDYSEYISKLLSKKIGFCPVFKSIEEIENILKRLDEVHLRVNGGLFAETNDVTRVSQALFHNVGIVPDVIQITAKFSRRICLQNLLNFSIILKVMLQLVSSRVLVKMEKIWSTY